MAQGPKLSLRHLACCVRTLRGFEHQSAWLSWRHFEGKVAVVALPILHFHPSVPYRESDREWGVSLYMK